MKRFIVIIMVLTMMLGISGVGAWAAGEPAWQEQAPMPTARDMLMSCVIGDKIYAIGGSFASERLNTLEIYNVSTNTWTTGTPMPTPRRNGRAVAINNKIYVIGGVSSTICNKLEIYDPATDTWTVGADIPAARGAFGAVVLDNKIYIITGSKESSGLTTDVNIYDPVTNTWSLGTSIPVKQEDPVAEVINNKIYVMGKGSSENSVQIYDPVTDEWSAGAPMPTPRMRAASAVIDNKIYVAGGSSTSDKNVHEIYDPATNTWSAGTPLSFARRSATMEAVNNKLYILGGFGNKGGSFHLETVESLEINVATNSRQLSVLLNIEETVQLSVTSNLVDNTPLTWTSSDEAVASVDGNGKVTGKGVGTAVITAQNSDGTFNEGIPVKVIPGGADAMRLAVHINPGQNARLYLDDDLNNITWISLDESIVTVSNTGTIKGVNKGLAIVQAELEGETYQIYVRVNS